MIAGDVYFSFYFFLATSLTLSISCGGLWVGLGGQMKISTA